MTNILNSIMNYDIILLKDLIKQYNKETNNLRTPLELASDRLKIAYSLENKQKLIDIIKFLIDYFKDSVRKECPKLLESLVEVREWDVFKELLLNPNYDFTFDDIRGYSLNRKNILTLAAESSREDIVRLLLEKDFDVSDNDTCGCKSVHFAGNREVMLRLISYGADPEAKNAYERTPLHNACYRMNINLIRFLLEECGVNPYCKDKFGVTPYSIVSDAMRHMNFPEDLLDRLRPPID